MSKTKTKKYYTLDKILAKKARYNVLFGERSNGKSYAVKYRCVQRFFESKEKFVYMRRWREDLIGGRAESYWDDMEEDDEGNRRIEELSQGEYTCMSMYRNRLYFANRDEKGKKNRGVECGRVVCLTGDTHEKSTVFVGYFRIIFEEMITDSGYLPDEVNTFMSLVSTILRKRNGEVFLIGNSLTKACPYFREWGLIYVPKQKQGTIDIYHFDTGEFDENGEMIKVDIACEYCENTSGRSRMIFGNKMMTTGEWQTMTLPHLPLRYDEYRRVMSVLLRDELELFAVDLLTYNRKPLLYVRLIDKKWTEDRKYDIVITESFYHDFKYLKRLPKKISTFFRLLFDAGKVCYEDNLVGTTFITLLKNRQIF